MDCYDKRMEGRKNRSRNEHAIHKVTQALAQTEYDITQNDWLEINEKRLLIILCQTIIKKLQEEGRK